jgi:hypothetical protein
VLGPVTTFSSWASTRTQAYSALRAPLPDNLHLLALKTDVGAEWTTAVLRLQHIYEVSAANALADPITVDPASLFSSVYSVSEELDLSGVVPYTSVPRMRWSAAADVTPPWVIPAASNRHSRDATAPTLMNAMQLKTYRLTFA